MARFSRPARLSRLRLAPAAETGSGGDDDDGLFAEELAGSRRQVPKVTAALLAAVVAALVFYSGVQAQQHFGLEASTSAPSSPFDLPSGGGFPTSGAFEAPSDSSEEPSGTADDAAPAVIGTVTKVTAARWIVTDLGGTEHTVTFGKSTTITSRMAVAGEAVKAGSTVVITGTTESDGSVSATGIEVR